MKLKSVAIGLAALAAAVAPVGASALSAQRSAAPVEDANELQGTGLIIGIVAVAAIIGGIILIADDSDDPVSA